MFVSLFWPKTKKFHLMSPFSVRTKIRIHQVRKDPAKFEYCSILFMRNYIIVCVPYICLVQQMREIRHSDKDLPRSAGLWFDLSLKINLISVFHTTLVTNFLRLKDKLLWFQIVMVQVIKPIKLRTKLRKSLEQKQLIVLVIS